ncbi:MAG: HAMP domain-containing histidine kinase [Desulfobacterales bacterium]|nr:HAMP domain-containing histidine kinase [Desulfobacterales bacterium]
METKFLPAERANENVIKQQSEIVSNFSYLKDLYSAVTDVVLILNKERQIVFYNNNLIDMIGIENLICGLRLGEVFKCIHAFESAGGCGTTEFCRECGAAKAILSSQKGTPATEECRIIQKEGNSALDLRVKTKQIEIGDEDFTIVAATDISNEKRRRVLERLFFHDIMNTAVGVRGLSELLSMASEENLNELKDMIHNGSEHLVEEIKSQRMLTAAENNELAITPILINSRKLLEEIFNLYKMHEVAKDKNLQIDTKSQGIEFKSDKVILSRVVGNMTKNALEACNIGDTVKIGCILENNLVKFWVNNPTVMPTSVKLQVFQRSFSTKGQGRGLGTYSMKLLSEKYLKGQVSFTTSEIEGTTFTASYPLGI